MVSCAIKVINAAFGYFYFGSLIFLAQKRKDFSTSSGPLGGRKERGVGARSLTVNHTGSKTTNSCSKSKSISSKSKSISSKSTNGIQNFSVFGIRGIGKCAQGTNSNKQKKLKVKLHLDSH